MKLAAIIPMAGRGQRFKDSGYKDFKPFIKVNGRFMVDLAIEPYPKEVKKFFIVCKERLAPQELDYLKNIENSQTIEISEHKNGPSYSIFLAKDSLPKDYSYFISYVDIYWTWDFKKVKKNLDYPGVIFTRIGWHPHLFKDNFSAFCLPKEGNPQLLKEIKEKGSFTQEHMNEPLSIGAFYFKDAGDMLTTIEKQINNEKRVAGEFYPSEIFNWLLAENRQVYMQEVDFFVHFGVPAQLEDFNHWCKVVSRAENSTDIKTICVMGGLGKRMKEISNEPKALMDISGLPMFEFVLKEFGSNDNIIVTTDDVATQLPKPKINYSLINIGENTNSQMETITKAADEIKKNNNFFMISCDAFGVIDYNELREFINSNQPDAIIFTFKPSLLQSKMSGQHTHVSQEGDKITAVHIKSKSGPNERGLAGFFYFSKGNAFEELGNVPEDPQNEPIADHFLKHLANIGKKVYGFQLESYVHIGTVPEYLEYKFWSKYEKILLR